MRQHLFLQSNYAFEKFSIFNFLQSNHVFLGLAKKSDRPAHGSGNHVRPNHGCQTHGAWVLNGCQTHDICGFDIFARPKYLGSDMVVSTKLDPRH